MIKPEKRYGQIHVLESQKQKVILDFMVFLCISKLHSEEIQFWRRMPKCVVLYLLEKTMKN